MESATKAFLRKLVQVLLTGWLTVIATTAIAGERPVTISGGPYDIPGILALPDQKEPTPAVLLLHGTASQKNEVGGLYARLARRLADNGIASLRIDFAGTGDSPVDYREYRLSTARRDARLALDYLAKQDRVDGSALVVLGFSQGGLIAQRLALAAPQLQALVTWSTTAIDGVGSFQALFEAHFATARDQGFASLEFPWLAEPLAFDRRLFEELQAQRTLTEMRAYEKPIFAVAGTADKTVDYRQSLALVQQSPNTASRVLILAGADHIFNVLDEDGIAPGSSADQLLTATTSWLEDFFEGHKALP